MNRLAEWMQHRDSILVMGILNVTPDSFHDGGRFPGVGDAVESALRMEADGADLIDLGGESSRSDLDKNQGDRGLRHGFHTGSQGQARG